MRSSPPAQFGDAGECGIPGAGRDLIAMRQDATLRPPGRAGCIQNTGWGLGPRLGSFSLARGRLQRGVEVFRHDHRRTVAGLLQGQCDVVCSSGQGEHQVGLRVVKQIGDLARAIVGIDRHTADTKRVQRQLVQDVFGPVLQQCGNAMAGAISGGAIGRDQPVDLRCRRTVGDLEPVRQVVAIGSGRNR